MGNGLIGRLAQDRTTNDNEVKWADITVVGELKQNRGPNANSDLLIQLAGYIREIFGCQPNRRFVHAFTLTKQYLRCWIFHRGGGFGSELININNDPKIFVDLFVGYGRMTPAELGFDTTLTFDSFRMNGCSDTFTIEKVIFCSKSWPAEARRASTLRGPGTISHSTCSKTPCAVSVTIAKSCSSGRHNWLVSKA